MIATTLGRFAALAVMVGGVLALWNGHTANGLLGLILGTLIDIRFSLDSVK